MPLFRRSKDAEYRNAARLLNEGKVEEAISELRIIIEKSPEHINSYVSLAVALMEVQENPTRDSPETVEAFALLDTVAELDPKNPIPHFNMGVMLRNLGQLEESLVSFEKAIEREERQPLALANMAEVNYELERWEEAIRLAKLALIRDPGLEASMGWVRVAMRKAGMLDNDGNVIHRPE
ncbi:MAG: tetratricopeptide repeat protein [Candidatus Thorarchaeota archaeon]